MTQHNLFRYYGLAICFFLSIFAKAQIEFEVVRALETNAATSGFLTPQKKLLSAPFWNLVTAGVSVGTDGLGIALIRPVSQSIAIRAGFNYADFSVHNWSPDLSRFGLKTTKAAFDISIAQSAVSMIGEWAPFKKINIRAMAGFEYAFQNQYIIKAGYKDTFSISSITLSPDEIGYVKTTITHGAKLAPFIGMGFGRSVPKNRYGFSFDFGAYYKGKPTAAIEGTGLLDDNSDNATRLNNNKAFQTYRWYPVATVRLVYRLFSRRR